MIVIAVLTKDLTISDINSLINTGEEILIEDTDRTQQVLKPAPTAVCVMYSKESQGPYRIPVLVREPEAAEDTAQLAILNIWAAGWQKTKRTSLQLI